MGDFLSQTDSLFLQRTIQPFKEDFVCMATYSIRIREVDAFLTKLDQYSRKVSDKEFTKLLEVKLSED